MKKIWRIILISSIVVPSLTSYVEVQALPHEYLITQSSETSQSHVDSAFLTTAKKALPSVVTIVGREDSVERKLLSLDDVLEIYPLLKYFGRNIPNVKIPIEIPQRKITSGSGFLINSSGYIVTNKHVVDTATSTYLVVMYDGESKLGKVVYQDSAEDIAVIKIDGTYADIATLGDSSELEIGQTISAIGNPYGRNNNTLSIGKIRDLETDITVYDGDKPEKVSNVIRTNAITVPGYSGGPVIDIAGKVVGMSVAAGQRSSFFIPINTIKESIQNYMQYE